MNQYFRFIMFIKNLMRIVKYILTKLLIRGARFTGKHSLFFNSLQEKIRLNYWLSAGLKIGDKSKILGRVTIINPKRIIIGKWCTLNDSVIIVGREIVTIGDNVRISPGAMIISGMLDYKNIETKRMHLEKPIKIDDNVWIGSGAIILPGVTIGKNSVIAAGAIVTKDVPDNSIVKGIPGKSYELFT